MKVHRAPEFYAGLLNNQPMGFYSSATLVMDAKKRGVRIKPVNVAESDWFCTVDPDDSLRLGLCYVRGLPRDAGERIVAERAVRPFTSLADFQLRTGVGKPGLRTLAKVGALNGLAGHRREAQWNVEVLRDPDDLFAHSESPLPPPLQQMDARERLRADYSGTGLTTGPHPMTLVRERVKEEQLVWSAADLEQAANGTLLRVAGLVICRQRPGTAKGYVFVSLEDETGVANVVLTPDVFESQRLLITEEAFLQIEGIVQNVNSVIHVKGRKISRLAYSELVVPASHDFH
jgi:error-prone DNA polymerase